MDPSASKVLNKVLLFALQREIAMEPNDLNLELVFRLLQSTDEFPVDFEDAWQWIGYTRKDSALKRLKKNFILGVDYVDGSEEFSAKWRKTPQTGRPSDPFFLTVDCFKSFSMMAGTKRGREVRRYFLDCEKKLKEIIEKQHKARKQRVLDLVVRSEADPWVKRFEDEFFDEAYRITGWDKPAKGHPGCMGKFINDTVYSLFPEGTPEKLKEVNPRNSKGNRARKHHQHLTLNVGIPILATQKAATIAVMRLSPDSDYQRFQKNMIKACGKVIQLELLSDDELDSLSA